MIAKATVNGTEYPVYNTFSYSERLDEELDGGRLQVITNTSEPFHDYSLVSISVEQTGNASKTFDFYAFDSVEKRAENYYVHTLELVELSRLLMSIMIDGRAVTQPIENSVERTKSLYEVVYTLARVCGLKKANSNGSAINVQFGIDASANWLEQIKSPEFKWGAGTLLWECLCDIGNVVDCIPRLRINGNALNIAFDKINDIARVYDI